MANDYNQHVFDRLKGCRDALMSIYASGSAMSSSSKGAEREIFVSRFLEKVLPPPFRFGTGEITDLGGGILGQVDVVVEFPFLPSFPAFLLDSPRLYLADGVAAAVEVKSDIQKQWKQVIATAKRIAALRRDTAALTPQTIERMSRAAAPPPTTRTKIPFIAVGYNGWNNPEALRQSIEDKGVAGTVDAALVIDTQIFVAYDKGELAGMPAATGPFAFWAFLSVLHQSARYVTDTGVRLSDYFHPNVARVPPSFGK